MCKWTKKRKKKKKRVSGRRKKKHMTWTKPLCTCTGIFVQLGVSFFSPPVFSHFRKKAFWWARWENTRLHYLFPLSSSQQNTLQNVLTPLLYIYIYFFFSSFLKFTLPNISKVYISSRINLNFNFCYSYSTCIYICKVNFPSRVRND